MAGRTAAFAPGQSHLKELASGFGRKLLAKHGKCRNRDRKQLEMWQGLKPGFLLWAFFGTTEVMPCYKPRFDGVFAAV